MSYRNATTGAYPVSRYEIIRANPHVSFPAAWGDDVAAGLGYDYVTPVAKPEPTATTKVVEGPPEFNGTKWIQTWAFVDLTAEELAAAAEAKRQAVYAALESKAAAVQAEKVRARDAGFDVDGTHFDSDQSARISYAELALRLAGEPTFSTPWKASEGVWVTMTAALYATVAATGATHIMSVFAWQAGVDATLAQIKAHFESSVISADEALSQVEAVGVEYEAE